MKRSLPLTAAALLLAGCAKTPAPEAPAADASSDAEAPVETAAAEAPAEAPAADAPSEALVAALAADHRSDANKARDASRHPAETLSFCGLEPDMTVVELSPGGGWYSEILAPVLAEQGKLVVGPPSADGPSAKYRQAFLDRAEADPEVFEGVEVGTFQPPDAVDLGEAGSADLVLTFRSTHGWVRDGIAADAFAAVFDALRPGGTFCVVQHRAPEGEDVAPEERAKTGYVPQSHVVAVAEQAGFALDATSEINANPKDTADHPKGVWTLPPGLRLGDEDRARYEAIGESDRMTLRFRKPAE